jgi:hypothetical protein
MKIREILVDAAKYPLSGWKQLIILGIMILIISEIIAHYNDLNINLPVTITLLLLVAIIVLITILGFFEAGYTFKIIEETVKGIEKPPKFNNLAPMLKHGINEAIILTVYLIIPLIVILVGIGSFFTNIDLGIPMLSIYIGTGLIILGILLGFVADIIVTVAVPHMASKSGALKDAFRLSEIFRKIRQIGLKKLLIAYLGVIIGIVLIAGPIFEEIITSVNIFGFVVGELIIAPYLLMFYARFIALIYRG